MTKRKLVLSRADFETCLNSSAIPCGSFSDKVATEMRAFSLGAFVVALEGYETNIAKKMYLVTWRCKGDNVDCLVTKAEQAGFHSKLKAIELLK